MSTSEGVEHLQAAAREMVAAARSFLDAVEGIIEDDQRLEGVVRTVTDAVRGVAGAAGLAPQEAAAPPRVEHLDLDG